MFLLNKNDSPDFLGLDTLIERLGLNSTQFEDRYLEGEEMLTVMLIYIDEIIEFCELFTNDFESVFMISPRVYFEASISQWCEQIEKA